MKRIAVLSAARPWIVWSLSALFVVYNFLQQVVPGIIAPDLVREFHLSAGGLGGIASLFFFAYAILQIPVGLAIDRFGAHRPLVAAVLLAAAGSLIFSIAASAAAAGFARLVIGAGAAFSFVATLKLVSSWFAPERFATLAGMTNSAGMLGAAGGGAPLALLVSHLGWRWSLGLLGALGIALALVILLFVRDRPAGGAARPRASESVARSLRAVIAGSQSWINALYASAISVVFVAFGALWGTSYVETAHGAPRVAAAAAVSLLFLGAIPGSLFFGWFSDRIRRRRPPMLAAAVGALISICVLLYLPRLPLGGLRLALGALGFFCSANIVSYAVSHDLSAPGHVGIALGFLNTCFYAGSAGSQLLVGWLLDQRAGAGGAALEAADFRFALSSVVGALVLALLAALLLRESHPGAKETVPSAIAGPF